MHLMIEIYYYIATPFDKIQKMRFMNKLLVSKQPIAMRK